MRISRCNNARCVSFDAYLSYACASSGRDALQPFLNFNKVDRTGHGFQTVKLYSSPLESLFFFFFFPDVYTCAFPNEDQLERFESEKFPSFFNPSEFNG